MCNLRNATATRPRLLPVGRRVTGARATDAAPHSQINVITRKSDRTIRQQDVCAPDVSTRNGPRTCLAPSHPVGPVHFVAKRVIRAARRVCSAITRFFGPRQTACPANVRTGTQIEKRLTTENFTNQRVAELPSKIMAIVVP